MLTGKVDCNDIAHAQAAENVRARAKAVQLLMAKNTPLSLRALTCIDNEELILERT